MNLGEKISAHPTIPGVHCSACGNAWWFDRGALHECTTCGHQIAPPAPTQIDFVARRNQELERERVLSDNRIRVLIMALLRMQGRLSAAQMRKVADKALHEVLDPPA